MVERIQISILGKEIVGPTTVAWQRLRQRPLAKATIKSSREILEEKVFPVLDLVLDKSYEEVVRPAILYYKEAEKSFIVSNTVVRSALEIKVGKSFSEYSDERRDSKKSYGGCESGEGSISKPVVGEARPEIVKVNPTRIEPDLFEYKANQWLPKSCFRKRGSVLRSRRVYRVWKKIQEEEIAEVANVEQPMVNRWLVEGFDWLADRANAVGPYLNRNISQGTVGLINMGTKMITGIRNISLPDVKGFSRPVRQIPTAESRAI